MSPVKALDELLHDLGDVPPGRVRLNPPPGTASLADLIEANEHTDGPICEWVDGTLVERALGAYGSWISAIFTGVMMRHLNECDLGMLVGASGVMRILPDIARSGDVTFIAWSNLPGGRPPARTDYVPDVVPTLVIEILRVDNRPGEMARKRGEYFTAGVKHVWEIDPETQTARVYTGPGAFVDVPAGGTLTADDVLPGFALSLAAAFARAGRA